METVRFTIPLNPVTKKNHGQIISAGGHPRLIPSKQYREYEETAELFCPPMEINEPVNVCGVFYMSTRRRVDIANLISALHDVLVHAGTLEDDNNRIIVSVDGSRVKYDKEHPRTEVEIKGIEENDE